MSIQAVAAGAGLLNSIWTVASLKCTKPGMCCGPNVIEVSKIIIPDGTPMASLSLLEVTERIAPIVDSWGTRSGVSAFASGITILDTSMTFGPSRIPGMMHPRDATVEVELRTLTLSISQNFAKKIRYTRQHPHAVPHETTMVCTA